MIEWKDVVGYEGLYRVNDLGDVESFDRYLVRHDGKPLHCKGKRLCPVVDRDGYKIVGLTKNGKLKHYKVHRLVAQAFIPNPDNLPQVNHKDENPSNNRVDNLEWCTCAYNNNYGTRNKRLSISLSRTHKETHYLAGKNNPMYGRHHTESTKFKISKRRIEYCRKKNVDNCDI